MFNLIEIDKLFEYEEGFTPVEPYVFATQISNSNIASYWTDIFGADGTYNEVLKQINSVILNNSIELVQEDSYNDMSNQDSSFYYDYDTQILYINTQLNLLASNVVIGVMSGYCTDTVRYFNNQEYIPIVTSIPTISESADPLQYSMIAFTSGSVEMANPLINNSYLFNAKEKLRGNTVRILRGQDGESYENLTLIFSGYVSNVDVTTSTMTLELGDNREKLEIDYPTEVFVTDEDDSLVSDTNDELIPDGYGNVVQAKAYPISYSSSTVTFRWATVSTSISQVYTYSSDTGLVSVAHANFSTDGTFTLTNALAYVDENTDNNLLDVYVTGRMRDYDNPADIIASLNNVVLGIEYNTSNYNTVEWESEKTLLADVALYMDESKSLYEWIEDLQSGSNYGFRYEDSDKRTIRLDNKDRTPITFDDGTTTIEPIDIRNSTIPIDQNADLYASSVIVKYNQNLRTETYSQVTNDDFYNDAIREFRVAKIDSYESLLTKQTDASEKALRIADDEKTVRPIIEIQLESSKYEKPRIYDIINGTASLLVQGVYQEHFTNVLGDSVGVLGDDIGVIGELFGMTKTEVTEMGTIEYYGDFTGQVIDIEPDTTTDTVTIKLRDIGD